MGIVLLQMPLLVFVVLNMLFCCTIASSQPDASHAITQNVKRKPAFPPPPPPLSSALSTSSSATDQERLEGLLFYVQRDPTLILLYEASSAMDLAKIIEDHRKTLSFWQQDSKKFYLSFHQRIVDNVGAMLQNSFLSLAQLYLPKQQGEAVSSDNIPALVMYYNVLKPYNEQVTRYKAIYPQAKINVAYGIHFPTERLLIVQKRAGNIATPINSDPIERDEEFIRLSAIFNSIQSDMYSWDDFAKKRKNFRDIVEVQHQKSNHQRFRLLEVARKKTVEQYMASAEYALSLISFIMTSSTVPQQAKAITGLLDIIIKYALSVLMCAKQVILFGVDHPALKKETKKYNDLVKSFARYGGINTQDKKKYTISAYALLLSELLIDQQAKDSSK